MGGAISWMSQRQKSIALSTTEAEFVAASEAAKELVWLTRLFAQITSLSKVPVLFMDNLSTVKLSENQAFHKRSKHIEVRHYFVREKVEEGRLVVEYIPGTEQIADILTKPLPASRFREMRLGLGLFSSHDL
jgi:hypothetical protein